ncbi:MAG: FecR domain-containing protein [Candidatus Sungbacteria bacterium]|nr:FecR domain-containing protein [Candidatus Sungbacteria bacterium]
MTNALKLTLGLIIGAAAIIGGTFYFLNVGRQENLPEPSPAPIILQVINDGVFLLDENGKGTRLISGTELKGGSTITTDKSGEAELQFPDGSVARVDKETTLTLTAQFFDENSGTSQTSLFLTLGRVWSRVAKLATPQSSWEVKTSNVVAAVRGTAFNVGFTKDKKSRVLVDKDQVAIKALNADTKEVLGETVIPENKFLELDVTKKILPASAVSPVEPPAGFAEDDWIKRNKTRDEIIKEKIEKREKELEEKAVKFRENLESRRETLETHIERVKEKLKERELRASEPEATKKESQPETEKESILPPATSTNVPAGSTGTSPTSAKTTGLYIKPLDKQPAYFEGTKVGFSAFLELADGTTANVTDKVRWSVSGPIGQISANGVLNAQITDINAAEFGKAEGSVNASLNLSEGRVISASEPVIIISPPPTDTGGNQG